ncbi:MAG: hypothetical protein M3290_09310 [Actinomycetota bacterium]|nr:hypothetical protein [Actinomycetota bacterium]
MIADLAIAILACAAIAYVAGAPRRAPGRFPDLVRATEDELNSKKRSALGAIIDIEDERTVGKLSQEDFEILRREYEAEALDALMELDSLGSVPDDDLLEAEIAEMRARLACPRCGAPRLSAGPCERCGG